MLGAAALALLAATSARAAVDATGSVVRPSAVPVEREARFDPARGETRIAARLGELCLSGSLPGRWTLSREGDALRLAEGEGAQVGVALHPAALADGEILAGHAASLQRDYEAMLGRPAQAAAVETIPGLAAVRWSATWFDANFAGAGALSLDRVIVQAGPGEVVEIELEAGRGADALAALLLASVVVGPGAACAE